MRREFITLAVLLIAIAGLALAVNKTSVPVAEKQLVVGEWYDVRIGGANSNYGHRCALLKYDADWLVFGGTYGTGVVMPRPWLQKVPHAQRVAWWLMDGPIMDLPIIGDLIFDCIATFETRGGNTFMYIRRSYAKLERVVLSDEMPKMSPLDVKLQQALPYCTVTWGRPEAQGRCEKFDATQAELKVTANTREHKVQYFMNGRFPILGELFATRVELVRQFEKRVPMDAVLCVEARMERTSETFEQLTEPLAAN